MLPCGFHILRLSNPLCQMRVRTPPLTEFRWGVNATTWCDVYKESSSGAYIFYLQSRARWLGRVREIVAGSPAFRHGRGQPLPWPPWSHLSVSKPLSNPLQGLGWTWWVRSAEQNAQEQCSFQGSRGEFFASCSVWELQASLGLRLYNSSLPLSSHGLLLFCLPFCFL